MAQAWRENDHPAGAEQAKQAPPAPPPAADDYAGAWKHHSPVDDRSSLDNASDNWNDFKQQHPNAALVASVLPVSGYVASAAELNDAHNRGDKADMALAAAGLVPGGSLIKKGINAIHAGEDVQRVARRTLTSAADYSAAKKAGQALKNRGAAKVVTGGAAETASTGSDLADYAKAWNNHAQ